MLLQYEVEAGARELLVPLLQSGAHGSPDIIELRFILVSFLLAK